MAKQNKKEIPTPEIQKKHTQPAVITALWYIILLFFAIVLIIQLQKPETDPKTKTDDSVKFTLSSWFDHSYQSNREERLKKGKQEVKNKLPKKIKFTFICFKK